LLPQQQLLYWKYVSCIKDSVVTRSVLTLPDVPVPPARAKALVFADPLSRALLGLIRKLARSDATVLVLGETGTGKEIVARHVHELSARAQQPFVAVNCAAFVDTLVESELFGQERGAFTGATVAKEGWFEVARGGTLFLDEVGDLPALTQAKLLRVLQEREVVRLGSRQAIPVDVRVVAATNKDLAQSVRSGSFREDLFYRLNVATIAIPPLRERPGDIAPLVRHFAETSAKRLGVHAPRIDPEAMARLGTHPWPGNIRELENVIQHALLVCEEGTVTPADLRLHTSPAAASAAATTHPIAALEAALVTLFEDGAPNLWARIEEAVIRSAYHYSEGNQLQTARLLGISRNIVRARLTAFGHICKSP
jgi:sigma-54 dependent transcriptional regulator